MWRREVVDGSMWLCHASLVRIGRLSRGVTVCLLMGTVAACQSGTDASKSAEDCNAKLQFRGGTYSFHPDAATSPRTSAELGRADVIGCDAKVVASAVPVKIDGVPVDVAVAVNDEWPGVYVAEGSDPASWPESLRR